MHKARGTWSHPISSHLAGVVGGILCGGAQHGEEGGVPVRAHVRGVPAARRQRAHELPAGRHPRGPQPGPQEGT